MKLKAMIGAASVFVSLAAIAAPASADGQLRGGMTSVKVVASTLASQTQYTDVKWTTGRAVSAASEPRDTRGDNFKWGTNMEREGIYTASNEKTDANEARSRWGVRSDAKQARSRWGVRSDAKQARSRWGVRYDADQARCRWGIRADANQSRSRWGVR